MKDLTIIIPLYNKEKYVADALDSVFNQKTDYTYNIIIADDCSTDRSLDIVREYSNKYPGVIKILESKKNQKLFKNVIRAYSIIDTPYFCVLGPDDYWTDYLKIQKSLDYLSSHPQCTIYVTNTWVLCQDGTKSKYLKASAAQDSSFDDFIKGRAVVGNALGSMMRNVVFKDGLPGKLCRELTEEQQNCFRGDTFITAIHIHKGIAHYEPECDAIYRITPEGIWQGMPLFDRYIFGAKIQLNLYEYFDNEYIDLLYMAKNFVSIAEHSLLSHTNTCDINATKEKIKELVCLKNRIDLALMLNKLAKQSNPPKLKKKTLIEKIQYKVWKHLNKKFDSHR